MRTLVQAAWLACAAAFLAPALPRQAPRRAVDSRIDDDYSDFDLNSASKPPENEDFVFPGALVQARDEYGQWYVAEVVECDASSASVKYLGWEDWPIEKLPRDRLGYMPKVRPPVPDEMLPEAELKAKLAATKKEKEMFQCQKFREAFCGSYVMTGERFVLKDGILTLKEKFEGSLDIKTDDDAGAPTAYDGWRVAIDEKRDALALGDVVLRPIDFDGLARGSFEVGGLAANGEAFSFARADGDRLACDVWTAHEKRLLTCRAVYERGALAYLDVVRSTGDFPETAGTGLFDVHPKLGAARAEVRLSGRATAACSPRCDAGGVLSLDWHAPGAEMRIQVDRVFADASGAIASLEITDVLADQAEQYVGVHSNKF